MPSIIPAPHLLTDRQALISWYRRNRERTRRLFDMVNPASYYSRPIALRNPIVFYEGHLPAFSVIAFLRRGLGAPPVDAQMEKLFERGIDPDSVESAVPRSGAATVWPPRSQVLAFGAAADEAIVAALGSAAFDVDGTSHPAMRHGEAIFTALEHEAMHQETLLYMWHRLPLAEKIPPEAPRSEHGPVPEAATIEIPAGTATLGAAPGAIPFGWDNEFGEQRIAVDAFAIDAHSVTNAAFLEFVEAGGYSQRELWTESGWAWVQAEGVTHPAFWFREDAGGQWMWRGMFEHLPLPLSWPVYVSCDEAAAYARWRGRRLPTEAEYHRAAYGTPSDAERPFPWGDEPPDASRGNFDFVSWDPVPAGARPAGASAWGVHDLVGNGWEWTGSIFGPLPGFAPMASYPEYSADFFDGQHYVMKGASPATARELVRRSFRNWFRPNYPYVYAKFRTVSPCR